MAGIVWRDKTSFLAVQRPAGRRHAGSWEFPGGKVESDEALYAALVRELAEEIGIHTREATFWKRVVHPYEHAHVDLRFFHVTAFDGIPEAREGQVLRWVTPEQALALPFLAADLPLLQELAVSKSAGGAGRPQA